MHWPSLVVIGGVSASASATRLRKTPHRHLKESTVAGTNAPIDAYEFVAATEGDNARSNTTAAPSVVIPAATSAPTDVVGAATSAPTNSLTGSPTMSPTGSPTNIPTGSPTMSPTGSPTNIPTGSPTTSPTGSPTNIPTGSPTTSPTASPTTSPTAPPTTSPTSYICGVGPYGPIHTAPSYEDCYLSGCPDQKASRCTDSSQCGAGACCMPTHFYGSYCVEAEPLFRLNRYMSKYIGPECRCRTRTVAEDPAWDATITDDGATPTTSPTASPTNIPTGSPTMSPTGSPTNIPTGSPTTSPTASPTTSPTAPPTMSPTGSPTNNNDANNKGDQELELQEEEAVTAVGGGVDNDIDNKGNEQQQPQVEEAATVDGDDGGGEGAAGSSSDGATVMTVGAAVLGVASTILLGLF